MKSIKTAKASLHSVLLKRTLRLDPKAMPKLKLRTGYEQHFKMPKPDLIPKVDFSLPPTNPPKVL